MNNINLTNVANTPNQSDMNIINILNKPELNDEIAQYLSYKDLLTLRLTSKKLSEYYNIYNFVNVVLFQQKFQFNFLNYLLSSRIDHQKKKIEVLSYTINHPKISHLLNRLFLKPDSEIYIPSYKMMLIRKYDETKNFYIDTVSLLKTPSKIQQKLFFLLNQELSDKEKLIISTSMPFNLIINIDNNEINKIRDLLQQSKIKSLEHVIIGSLHSIDSISKYTKNSFLLLKDNARIDNVIFNISLTANRFVENLIPNIKKFIEDIIENKNKINKNIDCSINIKIDFDYPLSEETSTLYRTLIANLYHFLIESNLHNEIKISIDSNSSAGVEQEILNETIIKGFVDTCNTFKNFQQCQTALQVVKIKIDSKEINSSLMQLLENAERKDLIETKKKKFLDQFENQNQEKKRKVEN